MNYFHVNHKLLLIFVLFIISILAKTKVASSNLLSGSVSFPDSVQKPKKSFSLSSLFRSLIQVEDPPLPRTNIGDHPRRRRHGKVSLSFKSEAPGPRPSPAMGPVSFPINAGPEMFPTSPPFPSLIQAGAPPSPEDGSRSGNGRNSHAKALLSHQLDAPAEVPTFFPGPSPILHPVTSSISTVPEMSPTSLSFPSLIQVGSTPSPEDGYQRRPQNSHRKVPLSLRSYPPISSLSPGPSPISSPSPLFPPISSPGPEPSPSLQPVSSPINLEPALDESVSDAMYSDSEQEAGTTIVNVKKVCETTDHPFLCTSTVSPLLNSNNEVSLDSVLGASINATDDLAKAAMLTTKELANTPGNPPELASALEVCKESYGEALDNFDKAKEAHDLQDVGTMNTMLSAVISSMEDCNSEFSWINIPSPVAEFSDKLINMTSNCLAIVSLL